MHHQYYIQLYQYTLLGVTTNVSPTYLHTALTPVAPKSVRIRQDVSIFLLFSDLLTQKLLVER